MKIRIEGCTQQELDEHSGYLTVGKEYEADEDGDLWAYMRDDEGEELMINMVEGDCDHLPGPARWVEVTE